MIFSVNCRLAIAMLLILSDFTQASELYKCNDNGKISYQKGPCESEHNTTIIEIDDGVKSSYPNQYIPGTSSPNRPAEYLEPGVIQRDADGNIIRSEAAKNSFKANTPCPTNGNRSGSCPGYVIDHIMPLACGGADAPSNMQWQSLADSKAKDSWERDGCAGHNPSRIKTPKRIKLKSASGNDYSDGSYGSYGSSYSGGDPLIRTGRRGGKYSISATGNKVYHKR